MRKIFGSALALGFVVLPLAASANPMSIATFLAKVDALQAKGMMAMLSSDFGLLKSEVAASSSGYRADAASRAPRSCPPPKGQAKLSSDELIASFRTVPPAQRATTSVQRGFTDFMVKRFPCK